MLTLTRHFAATRKGAQPRKPATELVRYAFGDSSIGKVLIACTDQGLRALRLAPESESRALAELRQNLSGAELVADRSVAGPVLEAIDDYLAGRPTADLELDLRGTPFQRRVWQEIRKIPHGQTITYTELARRAGKPRAVRAAGSACGKNSIGILVPCHRVLAKDGGLGGYGGGLSVKEKLLEIEAG